MRVVHCNREKYTHYIGRPSALGNPFTLVKYGRAICIEKFEEMSRSSEFLMKTIKELPEDAVLGCWCKPMSCHGDVIVKLWKEMHDATNDATS